MPGVEVLVEYIYMKAYLHSYHAAIYLKPHDHVKLSYVIEC